MTASSDVVLNTIYRLAMATLLRSDATDKALARAGAQKRAVEVERERRATVLGASERRAESAQ